MEFIHPLYSVIKTLKSGLGRYLELSADHDHVRHSHWMLVRTLDPGAVNGRDHFG